jgi:hypothetical protein
VPSRKSSHVFQKKNKAPVPLPPGGIDIEALLMIGEERMVIDHDENDNVNFMAEVIDACSSVRCLTDGTPPAQESAIFVPKAFMSADMVSCARKACTACPANFTSTRGGRWSAPSSPTPMAITRGGHQHYLAAAPGVNVLKSRLGRINVTGLAYGELVHNGVTVSLHPAGHVLGSAQVRMEHRGEVWVASGDYKVEADAPARRSSRCAAIPSSPNPPSGCRFTAGGRSRKSTTRSMLVAANAAQERTSVLLGYSFGKAQRILSGLDAGIGPIVCHGAVQSLNQVYRDGGVCLPPTVMVGDVAKSELSRSLVLAPPSAAGSPWIKRFGDFSDALPAAGCSCAARAGGAASTAASCCPTTPTGRGCCRRLPPPAPSA